MKLFLYNKQTQPKLQNSMKLFYNNKHTQTTKFYETVFITTNHPTTKFYETVFITTNTPKLQNSMKLFL